MNDITVCCVNYYSARYIRLSQYLLKKLLSEHSQLHWLIIDNTPDDSEKPQLLSAPDTTLVASNVREEFSHDKVDKRFSNYSMQHGKALNELVPRIETRYGLIIDPDCFVLMQDWDSILIDALHEQKAAAIGATYHPSRRYKYGQDFPMVTFFLFEAKYLLPLKINFCPGYYPRFDRFIYKNRFLKHLKHGTWKDTGWRVRDQFKKKNYNAVYFDVPMLIREIRRNRFEKLIAHVIPERFLDAPLHPYKRPASGLISDDELKNALGAELYEEHYFRGVLALIHLRAISQRKLPFEGPEAQFWIRRIFNYLDLDYDSFEVILNRAEKC